MTPLLDTVAPWFRRHGPEVDLRISIDQPATAETALRIGLVSEVHPADELSAAAEVEARRLATELVTAAYSSGNKLCIST